MHDQKEPYIYEIRIKESLSQAQGYWFEGMQPTIQSDGSTLLTGPVIDQSALIGLLNRVAALGLTLVSVKGIGQAIGTDITTMFGGTKNDKERP